MNVSIIGTGYVGLVSGVCLASKGHKVTCYDKNFEIVKSLNNGIPTFHEAGLEQLLLSVIKKNTFKVSLISEETVFDSEIIIIAVGTPSENGQIDLSYISEVAAMVGEYLRSHNKFLSIVVKSTVVPGTTDSFVYNIIKKESGKELSQFGLGMNPEFLREGNAVDDFMNPDRIVIGSEDKKTSRLLNELYEPWDCDKVEVNTRTAEMIKYANNSLLATQISAVNELANIAAAVKGIDILDVMKAVHLDKRWSPITVDKQRIFPEILNYLIPGCGFGGSCFPKDVQALKKLAADVGVQPKMLNAILDINKNQPMEIVKLLEQELENLKSKKILLLGLAFKDGTDDIRESVSIKIIKILLKKGVEILAHDPVAILNSKKIFQNEKKLSFTSKWDKHLADVHAIIVATKWEVYKDLSLEKYQDKIEGKVIFDARRFYEPTKFPKSIYLTVGRNI
tara:strand:- start:15309 stop:16661 length:1353 start_codon:yes stop_codon:yes gene_type:complete